MEAKWEHRPAELARSFDLAFQKTFIDDFIAGLCFGLRLSLWRPSPNLPPGHSMASSALPDISLYTTSAFNESIGNYPIHVVQLASFHVSRLAHVASASIDILIRNDV